MGQTEDGHKEILELKHEPVAGYRTAFYTVFAVSLAYLILIFLVDCSK